MLVSPNAEASAHLGLLLWVVCRICEYARVEATFDAIKASNHDSMLVCFEEFIIKDDSPLSVIHFSVAMCHEYAVGSFPTNEFFREGFECIGELSCKRIEPALIENLKSSYSQFQNKLCVQTPGRTVSIFYLLTHSQCQDKQVIV
jgi:hypothetical protein